MSAVTIPENWDEMFYLETYPDIKQAVSLGRIASGYEHFITYGSFENRAYKFKENVTVPLDWSAKDYLALNAEVLDELPQDTNIDEELYSHWIRSGRHEGRQRQRDSITQKALDENGLSRVVVEEMYVQGQFETSIFPKDYFTSPIPSTKLDWMIQKGEALALFIEKLKEKLTDRAQSTNESGVKQSVGRSNDAGVNRLSLISKGGRQTQSINQLLSYTHIFMAPWLKTGGADKAALLFANTVASTPGTRVLFLTTEVTESPWATKLDERIDYFDLGNFLGRPSELPVSLGLLEQRDLLVAYLLDNSPGVLHVINSHLGWFLLGKYGAALSSKMELFVSLYCYDYLQDGEPVGYARYLKYVASYLTGIFSDNTIFPAQLSTNYSIDPSLFVTSWHPTAVPQYVEPFEFSGSSNHILWASRLDRQKGVPCLIDIARKCPDLTFHVYGEFVMNDVDSQTTLKELVAVRNITFHGPYDNLNQIKRIPYRTFLYTSLWDGLPNILLEMGGLGLPIIAPDVGGIRDLVDSETGYLVTIPAETHEYIQLIRAIATHEENALLRVKAMKQRINERHQESQFAATLKGAKNYLSIAD